MSTAHSRAFLPNSPPPHSELSPSLGTREFAQRLTARTSEMLKTRAAVLVLPFGSAWEIAAITGPAHRWDRTIQQRLARTLVEQANLASVNHTATAYPAEDVLGEGRAHALAWQQVSLIPLRGSEGAAARRPVPGGPGTRPLQDLSARCSKLLAVMHR